MTNFCPAPSLPWFVILGISGGGKSTPLSVVGDVAILLEQRSLRRASSRARNTFPVDAFPARRRTGRKRNASALNRQNSPVGHGSLLASDKRTTQTGGRLLGVVREAEMFFQNVARDAQGNTLASLRKLYDKGRLSNVVMNDQIVFAVASPRFPFLMAAHLPEILRYLRDIDVSDIFARFEFLYVRPNYQWLSEYGDLHRESGYKTLIGSLFRMDDTSPPKPDLHAESSSQRYYKALSDLYVIPLEDQSAAQSYCDEHVDAQRFGDDVAGERKTSYRGKSKTKILRSSLPLDYLEKATRATKQDQPLTTKGDVGRSTIRGILGPPA